MNQNNIMGQTELCPNWSIWRIIVELLTVFMINVIMIVIVVSDDSTVVQILVGLVVVVSLGSQGCW